MSKKLNTKEFDMYIKTYVLFNRTELAPLNSEEALNVLSTAKDIYYVDGSVDFKYENVHLFLKNDVDLLLPFWYELLLTFYAFSCDILDNGRLIATNKIARYSTLRSIGNNEVLIKNMNDLFLELNILFNGRDTVILLAEKKEFLSFFVEHAENYFTIMNKFDDGEMIRDALSYCEKIKNLLREE